MVGSEVASTRPRGHLRPCCLALCRLSVAFGRVVIVARLDLVSEVWRESVRKARLCYSLRPSLGLDLVSSSSNGKHGIQ